MGVVYRARDLRLDRPVALKLLAAELADDERFRERFLRESRLAAAIDHPNIVPVYEAGEADGELFIAMRCRRRRTSRRSCARDGPLDAGARRRDLSARSPTRSTPPTRAGSSTATSSRATS